jgi:putative hydrolase of the HAD superfamily
MKAQRTNRCLLFDWGDTLMRVFPEYVGPMAAWPKVEAMPHAEEMPFI